MIIITFDNIIHDNIKLYSGITYFLSNFKTKYFLSTGTRFLDLVAVGGVDVVLRRFLRRWTGLDSLDDHGGALLTGPATRSHVSSCPHQLVNICSNSFKLF